MSTRIQGRCIALSDENRVCNVIGHAKEGDVVALLAGGRLAYVLRPVGDKYVYVGDAYVNGYANGAMYKDKSSAEVDREIRLI